METDKYLIFHNSFIDSASPYYIELQTTSTDKSLIQNNIFEGGIVHIYNIVDNFLDISCNYHEFANSHAWELLNADMIPQGAFDQPAGNVFIGTSDDIINFGFVFNYCYDPIDQNQEPTLGNSDDANLIASTFNSGICLSRSQISGIWAGVVLCIPGNTGWYSNWPECGDTWCRQAPGGCGDPLPPPTPVNDEEPGMRKIDPNLDNLETLQNLKSIKKEESNFDDIQVWPNPVENILNIILGSQSANIKIIDTSGKLMTDITDHSAVEVNVSDYPAGLYTVIINHEKSQDIKLIKRIIVK